MNNNDLFKRLHNETNNISPSDKLNPENIEDMLSGVKRKNNKKYISVYVALIMCFCICAGLFVKFTSYPPLTLSEKQEKNYSYTNVQANNYDEIYKVVKEGVKEEYVFYYAGGQWSGAVDNSNSAEGTTINKSSTTDNYSKTNVQVDGIDESDVVKTDGKYIYSADGAIINIIKPNNGKPKYISLIKSYTEFDEFYVKNNKVITISNTELEGLKNSTPDEAESVSMELRCKQSDDCNYYNATKISIYDTSDISNPKLESELTQSGYCITTRLMNGVLYVITEQVIDSENKILKNNPITYCPFYTENGKTSCVKPDSITLDENALGIKYITISSVDVNNGKKFADINSALGGSSEVYMSHNNIYISSFNKKKGEGEYDYKFFYNSDVVRFSVNETDIENNGGITVNGKILNQFSMDENKGYFRVVYLEEDILKGNESILAIYDMNSDLVGKIKIPVKNEEIKSVRFDNDIAYFVTYENTDPLFSIDLSNPKKPKLLSELKVTGYSSYLHPMNDNLLLGFGRETKAITGDDVGLKLSMFDVSDKENVNEISKLVFIRNIEIENSDDWKYTYLESEAEFSHKAIYIDTENYIIGIPYKEDINIGDSDDWKNINKNYYSLFSYDVTSNKFKTLKTIELKQKDPIDYSRGVRIGEYFYIVTDKKVFSYDYYTFERIS